MSIASRNCRIDWRPSRRLCLGLLALGLLAAASVLLSDLPGWARALLAPGAAAYAAWLARREWRRAPCAVELDAEGGVLISAGSIDAVAASPRLRLRGRLASLEWRGLDGRRQSLLWCADTLPVAARRQLLLRLGGPSPA